LHPFKRVLILFVAAQHNRKRKVYGKEDRYGNKS
jgi:hypothetical protein